MIQSVCAPNVQSFVALNAVGLERIAQEARWGEQHHPDGTGPELLITLVGRAADIRDLARAVCDREAESGRATWRHILLEEIFEAVAESDPAALRKELIQSAAVITGWVEDIDSRGNSDGHG